jgi:hypothetical protein
MYLGWSTRAGIRSVLKIEQQKPGVEMAVAVGTSNSLPANIAGLRRVPTRARTAHRSATSPSARRPIFAAGLAIAIGVFPGAAAVAYLSHDATPRTVAQGCTAVIYPGVVGPICSPGLSGGSVSAGAPSEELITAKNWCNLVIGGCSSAFFYPPGPPPLPNVDTSVRHSP